MALKPITELGPSNPNYPFKRQQLTGPDTPNLPQPIVDALKTIQRLERGKHVFASTLDRSRFTSLLDVNDLDNRAFATDSDVRRHLSPEDINEILANALRCFKIDYNKGVWNIERSSSSCLINFTLYGF
ncbi:uncharacterized protein BKA55DRAFT_547274 [Fusarium redolens]|uniref:Uncharacterized protein n=1 Tax=Fusarium redolens TaxID=48865 RepID=A0A9P9JPQ5_FUSRE|nr:uncharacterized protein BKA55DRAFT_547274 [Fusarium redolens]KAH7205102.1 hypothetical protein BKA55DRAFT_547274 [Fusarium redolens]